jgi:hypothetical protein
MRTMTVHCRVLGLWHGPYGAVVLAVDGGSIAGMISLPPRVGLFGPLGLRSRWRVDQAAR